MTNVLNVSFIWLGFFALAFLNSAIREVGLKKIIVEPWAHHLSALTAILLFAVYLFFVWNKAEIGSSKQAVIVGFYWLILTVLAETFIVGRVLGKQSWEQIFQNYNLLAGNLWPLVLLWVAISPLVFFSLGLPVNRIR